MRERGCEVCVTGVRGGCVCVCDSLYVERTVFNGFTIDLDRGREGEGVMRERGCEVCVTGVMRGGRGGDRR